MIAKDRSLKELNKAAESNLTLKVNQCACVCAIALKEQTKLGTILAITFFIFCQNLTFYSTNFVVEKLIKVISSNVTFEVNRRACMQLIHRVKLMLLLWK